MTTDNDRKEKKDEDADVHIHYGGMTLGSLLRKLESGMKYFRKLSRKKQRATRRQMVTNGHNNEERHLDLLRHGNYSTSALFAANELLREARKSIGISRENVLIQAGINPESERDSKTNCQWYELLETSNALPFFQGDFLRPLLKALKISVAEFKDLQQQALVEASRPFGEFTVVVRLVATVYQREILDVGTTLPQARKRVMEHSKRFYQACLRTTLISTEYYKEGELAYTSAHEPTGGLNNTFPGLYYDPDSFEQLVLKEW